MSRRIMHLWGWPALLAVSTIAGLASALLGTGGLWRWAAWTGLALPLLVAGARLLRSGRPRDARTRGS